MRNLRLLGAFLLLMTLRLTAASAAELPVLGQAKELGPIGKHYPVFIFTKSENPQNVLIPFLKLNEKCEIVRQKGGLFDFYWLMDGERYKPVNPLIKSGIRNRLEIVSFSADHHSLKVKFENLHELRSELKPAVMEVTATTKGDDCTVQGVVQVEGDKIRLEKIYTESTKTFWPPFRRVEALTFTGEDAVHGGAIERRFIR